VKFAEGLHVASERLRTHTGDVCIVVVDGHSAAGKSMFAAALAKATDAAIVPGDDFYRVMNDDIRTRLSPDEGIRSYYDWERMRDEALSPLSTGRAATYRPYDWESGLLARRSVTIAPAPVVVVEGLFVSRPELEAFADLSVLVEAPASVRWERQLERGDSEDWLRRWDAAERLFFEQIRPLQTFDIVVRGDDPS
jgi:uridine kinase